MKDYKELIAKLRTTKSQSKRKMLDDAADAIECLQRQLAHGEEVRQAQAKTIMDLRAQLNSIVSDNICRKALNTYGADAQTLMVFEEFSELQKELCKHARGKENRLEIAEEIADVQIMLAQMAILHDCVDEVADFRRAKIERLEKRLEKEGAGND